MYAIYDCHEYIYLFYVTKVQFTPCVGAFVIQGNNSVAEAKQGNFL